MHRLLITYILVKYTVIHTCIYINAYLFRFLQGTTPLHWGCSFGHYDTVKMLLGYNAYPNHTEYDGEK